MSLTLDPAAVARARSLADVGVDWLERLPGVVERPAREWGYIERVTPGLHLMGMGLGDRGRSFLEVAARLGEAPTR